MGFFFLARVFGFTCNSRELSRGNNFDREKFWKKMHPNCFVIHRDRVFQADRMLFTAPLLSYTGNPENITKQLYLSLCICQVVIWFLSECVSVIHICTVGNKSKQYTIFYGSVWLCANDFWPVLLPDACGNHFCFLLLYSLIDDNLVSFKYIQKYIYIVPYT